MNYTGAGHYPCNFDSYADEGYRQNAIVYRCVNEIANGAASIPFKAFQGDTELDQHPILSLLNRPNPTSGRRVLPKPVFIPSAFWQLLCGSGRYCATPRELHLLRPDRMRVKPSKLYAIRL